MPYTFTEEDAESWVNMVAAMTAKQGHSTHWAIRRASDGYLVGSVSLLDLQPGVPHASEIGGWMAKPYWGQGIITEAGRAVLDFGFRDDVGMYRVFAYVFPNNAGSLRVLQKLGFKVEGQLRKHRVGQGTLADVVLLSKLKEDP